MPTKILDLPLHPLVIHLPVVLVPTLALLAIGYVTVARFRTRIGWLLVTLTVLAPLTVFAARWSGQQLAIEQLDLVAGNPDALADTSASIANHSQYGDVLVWLVTAMAPFAWLFAGLVSGRLASAARRFSRPGLADWAEGSGTGVRAVTGLSGVILIVLAALSVLYVVQAGHTGASLLWLG